MTEKEAFAPRQTYSDGVYSSSKWPPNQPMCMHHELSYALEFPGLMLFACLAAPTDGGATAVADSPTVLDALPAELVDAVRAGGLAAHPQLQRRDRGVGRRGVRHRRPWRRRELLPRQRDRVRVATRRRTAHQAAPQRRGAAPGHRPALLVQPDRVPQRVDDGPRGARVPGGRLRRRRAAVQHPLRQRRPDRRGRRAAAQRGLRGQHRARAVAGRRPDARRQRPHRAQQGALRGTARGARRDDRPGAPGRLLADRRGEPPDDRHPFHRNTVRHVRADHRAIVRGDLRRPGPARAAGAREADRGAGRGHLPAARRRRFGEPAVLLPAFPRPPLLADHRAARLDRRAGAGGRPEVDLQLPGERGGRHPEGLGRADPQRPRHRLPVRLPGKLDHQRHQDGRARRRWRPTGSAAAGGARRASASSGRA